MAIPVAIERALIGWLFQAAASVPFSSGESREVHKILEAPPPRSFLPSGSAWKIPQACNSTALSALSFDTSSPFAPRTHTTLTSRTNHYGLIARPNSELSCDSNTTSHFAVLWQHHSNHVNHHPKPPFIRPHPCKRLSHDSNPSLPTPERWLRLDPKQCMSHHRAQTLPTQQPRPPQGHHHGDWDLHRQGAQWNQTGAQECGRADRD